MRSQLHQVLSCAGGFFHGSLIEMARRCGKPTCRCATDEGAKHRSLYLDQTRKGKTTMEYVPKELEQMARDRTADFQLAIGQFEQINQQGRARLRARKQKPPAKPEVPARKKAPTKKSPARKKTKPKAPPPS